MNVIGTRPDGWWHDRDGAMLRLVDQLERGAAAEGEDVVVAYLGVESFWRGAPSRQAQAELGRSLGLAEDRRILLSIGRIEERKGQAAAIRALQRLPAALRSRVTYLIVGRVVEKEYAAQLQSLIAEGDVDIRLVGAIARDELLALCHRAEALLQLQ